MCSNFIYFRVDLRLVLYFCKAQQPMGTPISLLCLCDISRNVYVLDQFTKRVSIKGTDSVTVFPLAALYLLILSCLNPCLFVFLIILKIFSG